MLLLLILFFAVLFGACILIYKLNGEVKSKDTDIDILATEKGELRNDIAALQKNNAEQQEEFKKLDASSNEIIAALKLKYAPLLNLDEAISNRKITIDYLQNDFVKLNERYKDALTVYNALQAEVELYQETLEINSYGLYQPKYSFDLPEQYLVELEGIYNKQKELIKTHKAIICPIEWTVGGSKVEGKKMINQVTKLMLFAFNGECDALIAKLRWNNVSKARERIIKAFHEINKLGTVDQVEITHAYFDCKLEELSLTYEYEKKKHEQKEEQRLIREQMREEEKAQKEFERVHREAEEEAKLYQQVLEKARQELGLASPDEASKLHDKIKELEEKLQAAIDKKERAIALAQTTKVGNIYVISNIGSFGENIYKIGMTRRFDPMDRIRELSDAALPFQFDVHAIIYSDNAPQFERDLHKKFWDKRINLVNNRKEFFKITLEEIETSVHENGQAQIQFTKLAEAREYRQTLSLIEKMVGKPANEKQTDEFPASLV